MKLALLAVAAMIAGACAALGIILIWVGGAIDDAVRGIS